MPIVTSALTEWQQYENKRLSLVATFYAYRTVASFHVTWVPVNTAWRILGLRMEIRRVAANIQNKQSRTAEEGLYSSLVLGEGLTAPHHKRTRLLHVTQGLET